MERSDAYYDGAEAYRQGETDADNPYANGTDESMDWFDGHANAALDNPQTSS